MKIDLSPTLRDFQEHIPRDQVLDFVLSNFGIQLHVDIVTSSEAIDKDYSMQQSIGSIGSNSVSPEGIKVIPESMLEELHSRPISWFGYVYGRMKPYGPFPILAADGLEFQEKLIDLFYDTITFLTPLKGKFESGSKRVQLFRLESEDYWYFRGEMTRWMYSRSRRDLKDAELTHPFDIAFREYMLSQTEKIDDDVRAVEESEYLKRAIVSRA